LNKLVGTGVVTTVTRSGRFGTTVQNELNREVDIVSLRFASNLDTIGKTAQGTMSPAAATVLRNVL
jgi:hypothetical protein